ncbi:MAG TPA: Trx7/PDZ domain-containing (seleno)protein [Chthoniobacteraceae bacterium]|nr:Trx7/PDZ domain-containing (seleno)protein [Chthoniobacteraceae bacterium]
MKALSSVLLFALGVYALPYLHAETVKDREGAVRKDRATMENDPRWIYNDFERGFAEAKRTGKPLLIVLRCVPCLSCAGIDAQVLEEAELAPLLDQFVCVRLINANAIDLARFQFDFDLSFSTLFFNGDGTVYGRYGSWTHQKDAYNKTTAGFRRALDASLVVHRGYPGNKATLAGKQGGPMPFKTPIEMPTLAGKYQRSLDWEGKVVQSCVHCHQIGDAMRISFRDRKEVIPEEWIYPWPMPETIGLALAPDQVAKVELIAEGSIAERAGFRSGDEIITLAGQSLVSIADVSWVLHRAPETGTLTAMIRRDGAEKSLTIELPKDWRRSSDISRRVGTWPMRAMAFGGLVLEDLSDEERGRRQLPKNGLGLYIKGVGQYGKHATAKNAGFQKEDVLISIDGVSKRSTESELIGHLLRTRMPGEKVKATVLRGDQRVELTLPMQ